MDNNMSPYGNQPSYSVPSTTGNKNPSTIFWLWIGITFINMLVVWAIFSFLAPAWAMRGVGTLSILSVILTVGLQWLVLRNFFPNMWQWFVATIVVSFLSNFVIGLFGLNVLGDRSSFIAVLLGLLSVNLAITLIVGLVQTFIFSQHVKNAWRWLLALLLSSVINQTFQAYNVWQVVSNEPINRMSDMMSLLSYIGVIVIISVIQAYVLRQFVSERNQATNDPRMYTNPSTNWHE